MAQRRLPMHKIRDVLRLKSAGLSKPRDWRRPRYLLSGLAECGVCGGGFETFSQTHRGCATARNKPTCDNGLAIPVTKSRQPCWPALSTI